jgi:hypothetical protein
MVQEKEVVVIITKSDCFAVAVEKIECAGNQTN